MDNGFVHPRHSGVVLKGVSAPSSAPVAVPGVAVTIIYAAVEADGRAPVTLVKRVSAASPTPPTWRPKQTHSGRRNPHARYPVIIVVIGVPTPITWSPDIAGD